MDIIVRVSQVNHHQNEIELDLGQEGWHDGTHVCDGKQADEQIVGMTISMLDHLASMPASLFVVLPNSRQDGHVFGGDTVNNRQGA